MLNLIKLSNGTEVTWEEFSTWSIHKQKMNLFPYNKGRTKSPETRAKLKESKRIARENGVIYYLPTGEPRIFSRRVQTPNGEFPSLKEAANFYGVLGSTIRNWINSGKAGFQFLTPPLQRKEPSCKNPAYGSKNTSARAVITPAGRFDTVKAASIHYGVNRDKLASWLKDEEISNFHYETASSKPKNSHNLNKKCIKTPDGIFHGLKDASSFYGVSLSTIQQRIVLLKWAGWEYVS